MSMATMNQPMNQGIRILTPFCRKTTIEKSDNGMIHKARVSFTVVATCKASCP